MSDWMWIGFAASFLAVLYGWAKRSEPEVLADAAGPKKSSRPPAPARQVTLPTLPAMRIEEEEDLDVDVTKVGQAASAAPTEVPTKKIIYDEDAVTDEPTHAGALILITATAQTDAGLRRKKNEDSLLINEERGLFVVADGMGGYAGGEVASQIAVTTIAAAFESNTFAGLEHESLPKRASELARSIQMANDAIRRRVETEKKLEGMGTTICAARFSPQKQRLYVGHVGDSRMYRLRGGKLVQVTSDHTMEHELGVVGHASAHLSRAVGIWPTVAVDVIVAKPVAGDVYLLCSDGLTKMVSDEDIRGVITTDRAPNVLVEALIEKANANGGKDNITVIVIRVANPVADAAKAAADLAARDTI